MGVDWGREGDYTAIVVIDTDSNGGLVILRDTELPRGMVIVRRDGETVEVLDVAEDGTFERLTDLLKKSSP